MFGQTTCFRKEVSV